MRRKRSFISVFAFLLSVMAIFALHSCDKSAVSPEKPVDPLPDPKPTTPPRVRGFMVQTADGLHETTINAAAQWGANVIRLQLNPASYALKQNKTMLEALPTYLDIVEKKVQIAKRAGMKVILDLHELPILVNGKVPSMDDYNKVGFWGSHPEIKDNMIAVWKTIAQKFAKTEYEDAIWGYDLMNEPCEKNSAPEAWLAMVPNIIDAIRDIDKKVWIVFQPELELRSFEKDASQIIQKDKKVVYSVHFYSPHGFTHQGVFKEYRAKDMTHEAALAAFHAEYPGIVNGRNWNKAELENALKPVINFASQYDVPILIGEFSVIAWAPVNSAVQWLKDAIDIFEKNKFSWCYHAFREWQGWSLEHPEGPEAFWFSHETPPSMLTVETQRAKCIKEALKLNATTPK